MDRTIGAIYADVHAHLHVHIYTTDKQLPFTAASATRLLLSQQQLQLLC